MHACISEALKSTKELFTNRGCYLRTCVGNLHLLRCGPLPTTQQFDNSTSSFALSPASCPLPSFSRLSICYEGTALSLSIPPVLTLSIVWKDHPVSASPGMGRILSQLQSPSPCHPIFSAANHKSNPYLGSQEDNQFVRSWPSCVRCIPPLSRPPSRSSPSSDHRHQHNLITPEFLPSA